MYEYHSKPILKTQYGNESKTLVILSAENIISVWKYDTKHQQFEKTGLIYGHFADIVGFVYNEILDVIVSADLNGMVMSHWASDTKYIGSYNMRNLIKRGECIQNLDVHHNGIILVATTESQIYIFKYICSHYF